MDEGNTGTRFRVFRAFGLAVTVARQWLLWRPAGRARPAQPPSRASARPPAPPPALQLPRGRPPPSGQGKQFYVSIGDSYAAGYPASRHGTGLGSFGHGYANQLPALVDSHDYHLTLVNFGCTGATTTSLISAKGCKYAGHQGPGRSRLPHPDPSRRGHRVHRGPQGRGRPDHRLHQWQRHHRLRHGRRTPARLAWRAA